MTDRPDRAPSIAQRNAARAALGTAGMRAAAGLFAITGFVILSLTCDARLAAYAETLPPASVQWGTLLSDIGLSGYMFAVSGTLAAGALVARALRRRRDDTALTALAERSIYIFAVLCVSGLAAQLTKHLVGRARPTLLRTFGPYHFDVLSMKNSLASFPSGHSTTAFAMAVGLSLMVPRLRVALFTLAVGICLARIVVQAHYASDIAAGAMLGAASALLIARAFARFSVAFTTDGSRLAPKGNGAIRAALAGAIGSAR